MISRATGNGALGTTGKPAPEVVSVVVPAFNAGKYLREAIDSLLMQVSSTLSVDIVLVDDGSTDETEELARSYGDRLRYVRRTHSGYPAVARNEGLHYVRGEYVAFLDADDVALPGGLERLVRAVKESGAGFAFGNYYILEDREQRLNFAQNPPPSGWIFTELFQRNFIHTSSVLSRRALVEESGGFFTETRTAEDYWLWLQLARRSAGAFVPEPVSVYRKRSDSISAGSLSAKLPDLIRVVQSIADEYKVPGPLVRSRLNPLRVWLAKDHWRNGRYGQAVMHASRAVLAEPGLVAPLRLVRRMGVETVRAGL